MPVRDVAVAWALALVLRLAVAAAVHCPTVLSDEVEYLLTATDPTGACGVRSSRYPPLYPLVLWVAAGRLEGARAYAACRVLNAVVSSLVVPLTWPLWRPAGAWGGCLVAILSPGVITSGLLLSENLYTPLLAAWLLAAARWRRRGWAVDGLAMVLLASACTLTRAAGAAAVAASLVQRKPNRRVWALLAGALPMAAFLFMHPPCVRNDPLAVTHPPEVSRLWTADLQSLTAGTALARLVPLVPWPGVYIAAWLAYWSLQYLAYVALGSGGLAVVGRGRDPWTWPLVAVTAAAVALAANHTLAGVQAAQFVRGRYVEPVLVLWVAKGLGSLGSRTLPWVRAWPFVVGGVGGLVASQNRAMDLWYPVRSVALRVPWGFLVGPLAGAVFFLCLRTAVGRGKGLGWATVVLGLGLVASGVRFWVQHRDACCRAQPARWLAAHDPNAPVTVVTGGADLEALKRSGLLWAMHCVRFFSHNPLSLEEPVPGGYLLGQGTGGFLCAQCQAAGVCLARVP